MPYYVPFDDSYFKTAPMVWSSWTSYYEAVREQDIVRNTDWLAANLKDYFWNQKEIGTWKGTLEVPIEPHDTRVLFIHPLLDRLQLVGMSRHISGTYSLRGVEWDTTKRVLRGISDTVADDSYTLWFHMPLGYGMAHVDATAGLKSVAVEHRVTDQSLRVRFAAQTAPVDWEIAFTTRAAPSRAL